MKVELKVNSLREAGPKGSYQRTEGLLTIDGQKAARITTGPDLPTLRESWPLSVTSGSTLVQLAPSRLTQAFGGPWVLRSQEVAIAGTGTSVVIARRNPNLPVSVRFSLVDGPRELIFW